MRKTMKWYQFQFSGRAEKAAQRAALYDVEFPSKAEYNAYNAWEMAATTWNEMSLGLQPTTEWRTAEALEAIAWAWETEACPTSTQAQVDRAWEDVEQAKKLIR